MVKVTFKEKDNKLTLKVEGHSGQAAIGNDIVCASCSILAYTVAQYVVTAESEGDLKTKPIIKLERGDALISCEPIDEMYSVLKNIYMFAEVGYKLLSHNFPQYVGLKTFETE